MTKYIISCCVILAMSIVSLFGQDTVKRQFLFKTKFDTTKHLLGTHVELKVILPKAEPGEFIKLGLDDRDEIFRSGYNRSDHIQILREYLTFEGDTAKSNRRYHFKPAYYSTLPKDTVGYTIQVEALYSFTRLLTIGFPPIRPTIVNRKTGEHLNTNLRAIAEVYKIYRKWLEQNESTDFKCISFPLEGSSYAWLGEDKMNNYHFRPDLFDYLYKRESERTTSVLLQVGHDVGAIDFGTDHIFKTYYGDKTIYKNRNYLYCFFVDTLYFSQFVGLPAAKPVNGVITFTRSVGFLVAAVSSL